MSDKEYLTEGTDRLLADILQGLAGLTAIPVSFCTKLLYDAFKDKAKFNIEDTDEITLEPRLYDKPMEAK